MRFERLIDDLSAQMEHEQREEERSLALEEERHRLGRLSVRERARALHELGRPLRCELVDGRAMTLALESFGRDWLAARAQPPVGGLLIVRIPAIEAIVGDREELQASLAPVPESPTALAARIGFGFVLRDLARRRAAVLVRGVSGASWQGTIDRVGGDHLELALHPAGTPRREAEVRGYRLVPFERISTIAM
ncbi:hypothetical protein [Agromyces soli]|uniref:Uncharacterized protein n=1 Tax=Agromyces soli TaxID=659012 RepID=A0ABY4ASZ0_9MICO|nr:hypothetical protein [Agromyces soli]UOE25984.1 hypothetical protein MTP13_16995 [Agromyces soli]